MTKPKTAAMVAARRCNAATAREALRIKRASATARLLAEPIPPEPTPAEFHALTCDCGATFVVGPREAASGRTLRCSMCRAEAVRAAMATVQCPSCRGTGRSFDWPCNWCRGARTVSKETASLWAYGSEAIGRAGFIEGDHDEADMQRMVADAERVRRMLA